MAGVVYFARADGDNGHVREYQVFASNNSQNGGALISEGHFSEDAEAQTIRFPKPVEARHLKFIALTEH